MKSKKYWRDRANERMASYHKNSDSTIYKVNAAYDKAIKDINGDINKIFYKYQFDSGLSPGEIRDMLNSSIPKKELDSIRSRIHGIQDEEMKRYMMAQLNANSVKARITRLEAMKESININTKLVADAELRETTKLYTNNINDAYYKNLYDVQKGIGVGFNVAQMPKGTIEEILKSRWSGNNYSKIIWRNSDVLAAKLEEVIISGLMSGRSIKKMSKELSELTDYGKFACERVIRTETTYVTNMAELQSYRECGIEAYRYLATLDLRTSKACRDMDGKIVKLSDAVPGENLPPLHPYCRSTTIAYINDNDISDIQRRARDSETGKNYKVPGDMSYNEWYDKFVVGKYGKEKTEVFEKMIKNKSSDSKQLKKYQEVLGKDVPKSLKEFQEMKYNDSDKWSELKYNYSDTNRYNKIVNNASNLNIKGVPIKNIDRIDLKEYEFDYHHINNEREHGVTKEMAQEFINSSKAAYSRWNGQVTVYVSENGCSVVNLKDKKVSTSYKSKEYDDKFKKLMEVLKDD